jgi:hypothetical protein
MVQQLLDHDVPGRWMRAAGAAEPLPRRTEQVMPLMCVELGIRHAVCVSVNAKLAVQAAQQQQAEGHRPWQQQQAGLQQVFRTAQLCSRFFQAIAAALHASHVKAMLERLKPDGSTQLVCSIAEVLQGYAQLARAPGSSTASRAYVQAGVVAQLALAWYQREALVLAPSHAASTQTSGSGGSSSGSSATVAPPTATAAAGPTTDASISVGGSEPVLGPGEALSSYAAAQQLMAAAIQAAKDSTPPMKLVRKWLQDISSFCQLPQVRAIEALTSPVIASCECHHVLVL